MKKELITAVLFFFIILVVGFFLLSKDASKLPPSNELLTPQEGSLELQVEDIKVGTGEVVTAGDTVLVHYVGSLENGEIFDSSRERGQPFETVIGEGLVIEGWDQGILGMKPGGLRKLIIPPGLAYGAQGAGDVIPPNATLTFEVELLEINPKN